MPCEKNNSTTQERLHRAISEALLNSFQTTFRKSLNEDCSSQKSRYFKFNALMARVVGQEIVRYYPRLLYLEISSTQQPQSKQWF